MLDELKKFRELTKVIDYNSHFTKMFELKKQEFTM